MVSWGEPTRIPGGGTIIVGHDVTPSGEDVYPHVMILPRAKVARMLEIARGDDLYAGDA